MPKHKLKPGFDIEKNMKAMIDEVVKFYGEPYDDRLDSDCKHVSLRQVAEEFNITVLKARKILITANYYSIEQSRLVNKLHKEGNSIVKIMEQTGLSKASVHSYLPYSKNIYNLECKSVGAERIERWRRKAAK